MVRTSSAASLAPSTRHAPSPSAAGTARRATPSKPSTLRRATSGPAVAAPPPPPTKPTAASHAKMTSAAQAAARAASAAASGPPKRRAASASTTPTAAAGPRTEVHIYIPPIPDCVHDESVYDLIPIAVTPPPKPPRYVSKFAGLARDEYHAGVKPMASMGPLKVVSCGPERWLHRGDGAKLKPDVPKHARDRTVRKAPLPAEPAVLPPPSGTDFIRTNRGVAAKSHPPSPPPAPRSFLRKANYGKTPAYLESQKARDAETERAMQADMHAHAEDVNGGLVRLPDEERRALLDGLKGNWEKLNNEYQKLSLTVDTVPKIARKVNMEQQLKRLEEDIQRFSHENIYVRFE
ncbi:hypothetical protein GGF31_006988 [Allomyces arbusculus]|nr:hypothetical protein GGF31_006988 [Allomyces arbusculus]